MTGAINGKAAKVRRHRIITAFITLIALGVFAVLLKGLSLNPSIVA